MIMSNGIVIEGDSLSKVWAEAFLNATEQGQRTKGLCPMLLKVHGDGDHPHENQDIRNFLDNSLRKSGAWECETVANTIFPHRLWNRNEPRTEFYKRVRFVTPRVCKIPANRRGTYISRMVENEEGGQLEHVISTWAEHENHRLSALQVSIHDPAQDHVHNRRLGFPCLQQVTFVPQGANGQEGMIVTAYYALQHLYPKAYGNILGLWRLGHFVAHHFGIPMKGVHCFAAVAKHGADGTENKVIMDNMRTDLALYMKEMSDE